MQPIYKSNSGILINITNVCPDKYRNTLHYDRHYREDQRANMNVSQFSEALWSLEEWPQDHWIGIIGGEPLEHPQLEEICYAIKMFKFATDHRIGIWTSCEVEKHPHAILIDETFDFVIFTPVSKQQCVKCRHSPITVAVSEVVENEELSHKLIEKCCVSSVWGGVVNHKGAYFCEVAAELDLLLNDGVNAWSCEHNWWKRDPPDFEKQIQACCYNCGMPVPMEGEPIAQQREKFTANLLTKFRERGLSCVSAEEVEIVTNRLSKEDIVAGLKSWAPASYREDAVKSQGCKHFSVDTPDVEKSARKEIVRKMLVTIPHYFSYVAGSRYCSTNSKDPTPRIAALTRCIMSFYHSFGNKQYLLNEISSIPERANASTMLEVDVVVCTQGENHILSSLSIERNYFSHVSFAVDPLFLGFECRRVLQDNLGKYDYYCYVEDDLIIHDPYFMRKIQWFSQLVHPLAVLQPNRFEHSMNKKADKCYIDGQIYTIPDKFRSIVNGDFLGEEVSFMTPPDNPHSGCYFLTHEQMEHWSKQTHFLVHDTSFVGPLESAATSGIAKTFELYKPSLHNANFCEIEHFGDAYLRYKLKYI